MSFSVNVEILSAAGRLQRYNVETSIKVLWERNHQLYTAK